MGQMGQMGQMSQMSFQHFLKLLDVPTTEQSLSETRRLNRFLESIHVYTRELKVSILLRDYEKSSIVLLA